MQRARQRDRVVVMFLDVDNFKAVNDSQGHVAGDQLLVAVAERLLNATRGSDTVARFGGDEFALLLDNVRDDNEARIVAERIIARDAAADSDRRRDSRRERQHRYRARRGRQRRRGRAAAQCRRRDVQREGWRQGAASSSSSRQCTPAVVDRLEMEGDLRRSVGAGEFTLLYQPLVELDGARVVGAEALVRWNHPRRGVVQPNDFIQVAEETGLIVPLGRWVLARGVPAGARMVARIAGRNADDRSR